MILEETCLSYLFNVFILQFWVISLWYLVGEPKV